MIELWSWPTPNGQKIQIALAELGLPFELKPVNIGKGEQFEPAFLALNPNHRIPAIVDRDAEGGPLSIFESGAILIYLAEKTGKLLSKDPRERITTIQWLMFQMGGIGPMFGQHGHFASYAPEPIPYAIDRYTNECKRLLRVLDKRLSESEWLGGPNFSIADIATWPWTRTSLGRGWSFDETPHVKRWHDAIEARPGVQRGLAIQAPAPRKPMTDEERDTLFGKKQHEKR